MNGCKTLEAPRFIAGELSQVDLPKNVNPDPDPAVGTSELLRGRFGEICTLNNYIL